MSDNVFIEVYNRLFSEYGPQGWWPVTPEGGITPEYSGGPRDRKGIFEVAVGAILTQNTAWKNVSLAIEALNRADLMNPEKISRVNIKRLASLIRSAGYYNQKARRLKEIARFFIKNKFNATRANLLAINGVGPETADSIMLYAFNEPHFVVDAYTRRIFSRLGLVDGRASYEEIKQLFEKNLPRDVYIYQEYHALIVEHGKRFCKKNPDCKRCCLSDICGKKE